MGAQERYKQVYRPRWVLGAALAACLACSAGVGGTGTTSVAVSGDVVPTMPQAPVSIDPNDTPDLPANNDLPIVPTPLLPGNVPLDTIWINPSPQIPYDVTGPVPTDVFYNQLGSVNLANDLASIVAINPNFIFEHITLVGRSLSNRKVYNITLYDPSTAAPFVVPVDDLLLATQQRVLLDGVPISRDRLAKVIWPALYVKALALHLGGYNASFSNTINLLTGRGYGVAQSVKHESASVIDPIVNQVNANRPVVTRSLAVSEGETITGVSPDDPNVALLQAGYTFGCTNAQGLHNTIQICLQANTAHYVVSYAGGDVRVRATTPHNAGAGYDGKYGYTVDGSSVMPLAVFIALTDQVAALAQPLPN